MKRKSPYLHPVRTHNRSGVRVHRYERGQGNKPKRNKAIHGTPADYSLTVHYPGEPSENVNVKAGTYTGAVREAFKRITTPKLPNRITIRSLKR